MTTFLHIVGEAGVEKYNTFTWEEDDDKRKISKFLLKFEETECKPRSHIIHECPSVEGQPPTCLKNSMEDAHQISPTLLKFYVWG